MMKIGMIVAVEINAVLNKLGRPVQELQFTGHLVYQYKLGQHDLFVIHSGAGVVAAAMSTQFLITQFNLDLIVNFGVAGGLTPEMKLGESCVVESVIHYDFDLSGVRRYEVGRYPEYPNRYIPATKELVGLATELEPSLGKVVCASGDKFIATREQREFLHDTFGADICEMEAAGIVLTCNKNKVPSLLIKTVSDSITGGVDEFRESINDTSEICLGFIIRVINELG
jgi:adenosylhomocysteine nucleosidase